MKCITGIVPVAVAHASHLASPLFKVLFTNEVSGWSVVATLNSYADEVVVDEDGLRDVRLDFIHSLMLLVVEARTLDADLMPAPSFSALMQMVCIPLSDCFYISLSLQMSVSAVSLI
jgi:hypothetical protein